MSNLFNINSSHISDKIKMTCGSIGVSRAVQIPIARCVVAGGNGFGKPKTKPKRNSANNNLEMRKGGDKVRLEPVILH
jgi:hypothetical protein